MPSLLLLRPRLELEETELRWGARLPVPLPWLVLLTRLSGDGLGLSMGLRPGKGPTSSGGVGLRQGTAGFPSTGGRAADDATGGADVGGGGPRLMGRPEMSRLSNAVWTWRSLSSWRAPIMEFI